MLHYKRTYRRSFEPACRCKRALLRYYRVLGLVNLAAVRTTCRHKYPPYRAGVISSGIQLHLCAASVELEPETQ